MPPTQMGGAGLLHRPGQAHGLDRPFVAAVEGERPAAEHPPHHVDRLLQVAQALAGATEGHAGDPELLLVPARAQADGEPAAGDDVEVASCLAVTVAGRRGTQRVSVPRRTRWVTRARAARAGRGSKPGHRPGGPP